MADSGDGNDESVLGWCNIVTGVVSINTLM